MVNSGIVVTPVPADVYVNIDSPRLTC